MATTYTIESVSSVPPAGSSLSPITHLARRSAHEKRWSTHHDGPAHVCRSIGGTRHVDSVPCGGRNLNDQIADRNADLAIDADEIRDINPAPLPIDPTRWDDPEPAPDSVSIDDPHDLIERLMAEIGEDAANKIEEQIRGALQHHVGGRRMRVIADTTYRQRSHPAVQELGTADAIRGLGLWVWCLSSEYEYTGDPSAQQVADTVVAHWEHQDREYGCTMEWALRQTLSWLTCLDDLPEELWQTLDHVVITKHSTQCRKTGLTPAECVLTMLCYSLSNGGGELFFAPNNIANRLTKLGIITDGKAIRTARALLESAGILTCTWRSDQRGRSSEFVFASSENCQKTSGILKLSIPPAVAHTALKTLDRLSRSQVGSASQSQMDSPFPSGEQNSCGGELVPDHTVASSGGELGGWYQKADVLDASAGREVEILERVCGWSIDEKKLGGQPCPRCGGTDKWSLRPDRRDISRRVMHCRGCEWRGADVIQAVSDARGVDFPDALAKLGDYLHVPARRSPRRPKPVISDRIYDDVAGAHGLKPESLRTVQAKPAIREHRLDNGHVLRNLVLRVTTYKPEKGRLVPGNPVDLGTDTPKLRKGMCLRGRGAGVFVPRDQLISLGDTVVIVEGVKDSLRLQELHPGLKWIGLPGAYLPCGDWGSVLRGCHVVVIPDGDRNGIDCASDVQRQLAGSVATCSIERITDEIHKEKGDGIRQVAATPEGRARIAAAIRAPGLSGPAMQQ